MPAVVAIVSAETQERVDLPSGLISATLEGTRDSHGHVWLVAASAHALRVELADLLEAGESPEVIRRVLDLVEQAERVGTGIAVIVGPASA